MSGLEIGDTVEVVDSARVGVVYGGTRFDRRVFPFDFATRVAAPAVRGDISAAGFLYRADAECGTGFAVRVLIMQPGEIFSTIVQVLPGRDFRSQLALATPGRTAIAMLASISAVVTAPANAMRLSL